MGSNYAGNVQTPNMIQASNMPQAYNQAYGDIGTQSSTYSGLGAGVLPQAQTTASNLVNNPYSTQALTGATGAATLGGSAANAGYTTGQQLTSAGTSLVPYASQIMQSGFDPQQALYNQQYQQNQDQTNVNNAMYGVAGTPYGAGLANQSSQNFNTNWENQQLGREATAANAASGLVGTGASVAGQGVNMQNAAPGQMVQSSMIPYATYSDIGQGQNSALTSLLGIGQSGANLSNMSINDLLKYIGVGNQTTSAANQTAQVGLNQSNLGWNQMSQLGSGLGSLAGNAFSALAFL